MKKRYISDLLCVFLMSCIMTVQASESLVTAELCQYVLQATKLPEGLFPQTVEHTFAVLDDFFRDQNVITYTDAALFGSKTTVFDNPDEFNKKMSIFRQKGADIVPEEGKKYQCLVFNTSGIDVFMERLAFLSRLVKKHNIQTDQLFALMGDHPHRQDLRDSNYLLELPTLFSADFDLTAFNRDEVEQNTKIFNEQDSWTHCDGMVAAWQLIKCDPVMAELKHKFTYFYSEERFTEGLLKVFIFERLRVTQDAPVGFIVNAQTAPNIQEMIKKHCSHLAGAIDVLVAQPVEEEIEAKLFNDTPQQRAMTKLFHFYRLLDVMRKK